MIARDGALTRALWVGEDEVLVRAWGAGSAVRLRAEAGSHDSALKGIERMRFALGVDHDLARFIAAFAGTRLSGR